MEQKLFKNNFIKIVCVIREGIQNRIFALNFQHVHSLPLGKVFFGWNTMSLNFIPTLNLALHIIENRRGCRYAKKIKGKHYSTKHPTSSPLYHDFVSQKKLWIGSLTFEWINFAGAFLEELQYIWTGLVWDKKSYHNDVYSCFDFFNFCSFIFNQQQISRFWRRIWKYFVQYFVCFIMLAFSLALVSGFHRMAWICLYLDSAQLCGRLTTLPLTSLALSLFQQSFVCLSFKT